MSFVLPLFTILLGCGPSAKISGIVFDGFGKPLPDAEVSILSTDFKTTTRSNGRYDLQFAPGKFSVTFTKPSYSDFTLTEEIVSEVKVPLGPVTLYRRPAESGISFFGDTDYVQLSAGKLLTNGADRRNFAWTYQMTYRASGDFATIPSRTVHRFLDTHPAHLSLVKLIKDDILGTRSEAFMGMGQTNLSIIKEKVSRIENGMAIREASLGPGRYAYVAIDENFGRLSEPLFLFEVQ